MTPRSYEPQERQRAVDAGRDRILTAAREILNLDDVGAFSLDAVARRAGVTRMTVYNQFGSKSALLGELFDTLIERDAFSQMPEAFQQEDIGKAFDILVGVFGRFYTDNRALLSQLAGNAGLDPDLAEAIRTRNLRRRQVIESLVKRIKSPHEAAVRPEELVNTLDVLLGFPTFNGMAGPARTPKAIVPHMRQVVRSILGCDQPRVGKPARRRVRKKN